jgi:hypothetical protein
MARRMSGIALRLTFFAFINDVVVVVVGDDDDDDDVDVIVYGMRPMTQ